MLHSILCCAALALVAQNSSTTIFAIDEANSTGNVHLALVVGGQPISTLDIPVTFGGYLDIAVERDATNIPSRALMWSSSALSVRGLESFVVDLGLLGTVPVQFAHSVLHFGRQSGGSVISNPIMPLSPGPQAGPLPTYQASMGGHGLQFRGVVSLGPASGPVEALLGGPGQTAVYDYTTFPFAITIPSGTTLSLVDDGSGLTTAMIALDTHIQDVLGTEGSTGVRADLTITGGVFGDYESTAPIPIVEPPVAGGSGTGGFVIPFIPLGTDPLEGRADILTTSIPEARSSLLLGIVALPLLFIVRRCRCAV